MTDQVTHAPLCNCRACKRRRNLPAKTRCDCCGKTRMCQQVTIDKLAGPKTWDPHYCVRECLQLTGPERAAKRKTADAERREERQEHPPLAWPIVGGPLAGQFAVPADFYSGSGEPGDTYYRPGGKHAHRSREYTEWNAAHGGNRRIGGFPTMIFVHTSLTPPMIRGRDR